MVGHPTRALQVQLQPTGRRRQRLLQADGLTKTRAKELGGGLARGGASKRVLARAREREIELARKATKEEWPGKISGANADGKEGRTFAAARWEVLYAT